MTWDLEKWMVRLRLLPWVLLSAAAFTAITGCSFKGRYISGPIGGDAELATDGFGETVVSEDTALWDSFVDVSFEETVLGPECDNAAVCVGVFGVLRACEEAYCDPASGRCVKGIAQNGWPCDDDNPCTSGDSCKGGVCAGGQNLCECDGDADCAIYDDDNLCNGRLFCDRSQNVFRCEVNPDSVVICDAGLELCTERVCDPETGICLDQSKTCPAPDPCHLGECDEETGFCTPIPRCVAPDSCHEAACVAETGTCMISPRTCAASDLCHVATCSLDSDGCVEVPRDCPAPPPCHDGFGCDPATGSCVVAWQPFAQEGPKGDSSCGDGHDNDCDELTDGDDPDCALEVTGVSPATGPVGVATEVTLTGGGFEDGLTRVLFSDLEATLVSISQTEIKVTTPITATAGLVDIRVVKSHISIKQVDAFTFTEAADR